MTVLKKVLLVAIAVSMLVFLAIFFLFPAVGAREFYHTNEISSAALNSRLYFKTKVWGLSSDHQVSVISEAPDRRFTPDSSRDYIFTGCSPLLYQVRQDSLIIITMTAAAIPKKIKTNFKIIQRVVGNDEMTGLIGYDHYKGQGWTLVQ